MKVIVRMYPGTAWPERAEPISEEELEKMLAAGDAHHVEGNIYRTKVMRASPSVATPVELELKAEADPLSIACPFCDAPVGGACTTSSGSEREPHKQRLDALA